MLLKNSRESQWPKPKIAAQICLVNPTMGLSLDIHTIIVIKFNKNNKNKNKFTINSFLIYNEHLSYMLELCV